MTSPSGWHLGRNKVVIMWKARKKSTAGLRKRWTPEAGIADGINSLEEDYSCLIRVASLRSNLLPTRLCGRRPGCPAKPTPSISEVSMVPVQASRSLQLSAWGHFFWFATSPLLGARWKCLGVHAPQKHPQQMSDRTCGDKYLSFLPLGGRISRCVLHGFSEGPH